MSTETKTTPEQAITQAWDYLFGHDLDCPRYVPGLRVDESDDCGCGDDWDSDTIEVVVDILREGLPDGFIKHRAQVIEVLIGQYGRHQVVRYHPGCVCGWTARDNWPTHGEALHAALRLHLDDIKMNERA